MLQSTTFSTHDHRKTITSLHGKSDQGISNKRLEDIASCTNMPADKYGVKWACQPCIRGHRSTKCQHWDRFMVKVKKPGRPLSTCPHTNDSCSCFRSAVMMMRVMKGTYHHIRDSEYLIDYCFCIDSKCFCAPVPKSKKPRKKVTGPGEESEALEPEPAKPEADTEAPKEDEQSKTPEEPTPGSPNTQGI